MSYAFLKSYLILADLKTIEERFLAPQISFIEILESFVETQKNSKGRRIVNVQPTNVESSLQLMLPRRYNVRTSICTLRIEGSFSKVQIIKSTMSPL